MPPRVAGCPSSTSSVGSSPFVGVGPVARGWTAVPQHHGPGRDVRPVGGPANDPSRRGHRVGTRSTRVRDGRAQPATWTSISPQPNSTKLRSAGVRLAIDDVGDGYSSLRVATTFKPDVLKLAGELIASLPSGEAVAIVKAVVDLAHRTGAWVVAESRRDRGAGSGPPIARGRLGPGEPVRRPRGSTCELRSG